MQWILGAVLALTAQRTGFAQAPAEQPAAVPAPAIQQAQSTDSPSSSARDPLVAPPGDVPAPTAVGPASVNPQMKAVWRDGLFIESPRKSYSVHMGGVVQYDGAWYSAGYGVQNYPGGIGVLKDGTNLRRARIRFEGFMYKNVEYTAEFEMANGLFGSPGTAGGSTTFSTPGATDVFVGMTDIPLFGTIRIGNQREPISLEHLNSARFLEFMERSPLFDLDQASAFNAGRSPGIMGVRNWGPDDRIYTAGGFFKNVSDVLGFGVGDGQYAATGRIAGLPIWKPDDRQFWHVGGAMSHRDPVGGQVQIRVRNDIRNAPGNLLNLLANTGLFNATSQDIYDVETAAVNGRWTFQAEYMANFVHGASTKAAPDMGTVFFQGYYAEALCFLTGESRTWRLASATFDRVRPLDPLRYVDGHVKGTGAWEVGARFSHINLNDKAIVGGQVNSVTLGLNWYWNPNAKLQFNYDYAYRDEASNPLAQGSIHSFGTRAAYDF